MEIKGRVHEVGATRQVSGTFRKRDLVVLYAENPQWPEYVRFEATGDRTAIFDGLAVGDAVTVRFNLRGRPWTDKNGKTSYFNTLLAWKVEKGGAAQGAPSGNAEREGDGLPF